MSERHGLYDEKCFELAQYFLLGEKGGDPCELAQTIQDAIEDWLEANKVEVEP